MKWRSAFECEWTMGIMIPNKIYGKALLKECSVQACMIK